MKYTPLLLILLIAVNSCKLFHNQNRNYAYDTDSLQWESQSTDSISYEGEEWTAPNEILYKNYKPSNDKSWLLVHTDLDLKFSFAERSVSGVAKLTLTPCCKAQDTLVLDMVKMRIDKISIVSKTNKNLKENAKFQYRSDSTKITLYLAEKWKSSELLQLEIQYTASPYNVSSNGNAAISDDKGLYFINHDLSDPTKPRQIWSQGETQSNSHWFPTIDAPNQKTTQRISLTVPDTMITLSNGKMITSTPVGAGLRQDIWEQNLPHAPYLTMIAIGNWALVKDTWKGKQVNYLVEKAYKAHAPLIFGNTPAMIEFYSNYLGVPYAWDKYSQVVVRDFVSGAMENTTATVHMEQLQHTPRQHFDETYEDYISHELFHQWFGDLVTTESWSNITLNESFATYGQYLWRQHFYGQSSADFILDDFRENYNQAFNNEVKNLVRFNYENSGELFDQISYQKGACILHMLRYTIGEEAFRAGLKVYLEKYKFGTAEATNLRLAFEEVTGTDLNWFFNQWYYGSGHPKIYLAIEKNEETKDYWLRIEQIQQTRNSFIFPVKIAFGANAIRDSLEILVTKRIERVKLGGYQPEWFLFDANNSLLADINFFSLDQTEINQQIEMLNKAWDKAPNLTDGDRHKLFSMALDLWNKSDSQEMRKVFIPILHKAILSNYMHTATKALSVFSNYSGNKPEDFGLNMNDIYALVANNKLHKEIRMDAFQILAYHNFNTDSLFTFIKDTSIALASEAIYWLGGRPEYYDHAYKVGITNSESAIATAWARSLIVSEKVNAAEILNKYVLNKHITGTDFSYAFNTFVLYASDENILTQLPVFFDSLKQAKNRLFIKVVGNNLKNVLESALNEAEIARQEGSEPSANLVSRIALYQRIIQESTDFH